MAIFCRVTNVWNTSKLMRESYGRFCSPLPKLFQKANTINLQTIADARLFCKSPSLIYVNETRDNLVRTLLQTSLALCVFPVRLYYTDCLAIALYFRCLIFCTTWSICAIIKL